MNDTQIDQLKEIESIAILFLIAQDSEQIDGSTLQRIGEQIIAKCRNIESIN